MNFSLTGEESMGANIRIHEWRVERRLRHQATRGMGARRRKTSSEKRHPPGDLRAKLPPLGLREYWYPALPESRVGRKPLYWTLLGDELTFFRGVDGRVVAVSDICPHRGASMSRGDCHYTSTISCPYHAATFNENGDCVAFLTEGPDSKMVGNLRIRTYPTVTLRGWVFVWMGDQEPAPLEEDIPPEFFESDATSLLSTYTYWACSWILAIENQNDSHNCLYVHRNSVMQLTADRSRRRTPIGPRSRLIGDRALVPLMHNQDYYAREDGTSEFQMYYPGIDGKWPKTSWRKKAWRVLDPLYRYVIFSPRRLRRLGYPYQTTSDEWASASGASCWHLPSAIRVNFGPWMYTRYAVPVDEDISRVIYFHSRRVPTRAGRLALRVWFRLYFNWWLHYNFSTQDSKVAAPCRYWTEENFAPTDSHLILLRKLVGERSRDAKLRESATSDQRTASASGTADETLEQAARLSESARPVSLLGFAPTNTSEGR